MLTPNGVRAQQYHEVDMVYWLVLVVVNMTNSRRIEGGSMIARSPNNQR